MILRLRTLSSVVAFSVTCNFHCHSGYWFAFILAQTRCRPPRNVECLVTCLIRRYTSSVTSISTHRVFLMKFDLVYRFCDLCNDICCPSLKGKGVNFISKLCSNQFYHYNELCCVQLSIFLKFSCPKYDTYLHSFILTIMYIVNI